LGQSKTDNTFLLIFYFSIYISATCVFIKHGDLMVANLGDGRAVASVHNMAKALTQVL
jgi:serine/threonine protein phosphatase PrpC